MRSTIDDILGEKINLPVLYTYNPFSNSLMDSTEIFNSHYRIFTHINTSCGDCILKINLWENLVLEFSKLKVPIILICESDDNFKLFKSLCKSGFVEGFSYPFFLNKEKGYLKKNPFMEAKQDFETVLTDCENNILLLGNPTRSKEMKELYIKEIQKKMKLDNI